MTLDSLPNLSALDWPDTVGLGNITLLGLPKLKGGLNSDVITNVSITIENTGLTAVDLFISQAVSGQPTVTIRNNNDTNVALDGFSSFGDIILSSVRRLSMQQLLNMMGDVLIQDSSLSGGISMGLMRTMNGMLISSPVYVKAQTLTLQRQPFYSKYIDCRGRDEFIANNQQQPNNRCKSKPKSNEFRCPIVYWRFPCSYRKYSAVGFPFHRHAKGGGRGCHSRRSPNSVRFYIQNYLCTGPGLLTSI